MTETGQLHTCPCVRSRGRHSLAKGIVTWKGPKGVPTITAEPPRRPIRGKEH